MRLPRFWYQLSHLLVLWTERLQWPQILARTPFCSMALPLFPSRGKNPVPTLWVGIWPGMGYLTNGTLANMTQEGAWKELRYLFGFGLSCTWEPHHHHMNKPGSAFWRMRDQMERGPAAPWSGKAQRWRWGHPRPSNPNQTVPVQEKGSQAPALWQTIHI